MNSINYFNYLMDALRLIMQSKLDIFVGEGQNLFRLAAVIVIALFGMEWGLGGWSMNEGMQKFFSLIMSIGMFYTMIMYYDSPIPGIGMSFPAIITREGEWLARTITQSEAEVIINRLTALWAGMESPGITDIIAILCYSVVVATMLLAGALGFVVTAFGLIAQSVCLLFGPIMIPFGIVPRMDFLFWGWLKCLIQYSLFQAVCAAVLFILGNALVPAMSVLPQNISIEVLIGLTPGLMVVLLAIVYAILKIPSITNQLVSGTAGGGLSSAIIAVTGRFIG